jgi:hypothetical protein
MCKCVRLYNNSVFEIAKSENGKWFHRSLENNGFGYRWTKWDELRPLTGVERCKTTFENLNGNEITTHCLKFDFGGITYFIQSGDKRSVNGLRYRLPN